MVLLLVGGGDLVLALREHVEAHQQRRPERHDERRGAERAGDERGVLRVGHAGAERELLERDVADVEPARPARLVLAVDMVQVPGRIRVDARVRELEQLGAAAEGERAGGADLSARRLQPGGLARRAERALADPRGERVVLVLGNLERAGHHAVPAAHALARIVGDRPLGLLVEGPDRTRGGARGRDAVHALPLREALLVLRLVHDGDAVGAVSRLGSNTSPSGGGGLPFASAHAASQPRQPTQRVVSTSTPGPSAAPSAPSAAAAFAAAEPAAAAPAPAAAILKNPLPSELHVRLQDSVTRERR